MRVVHCYRTYFPDPQGGAQEAIRQIALSTQAEGVENTIFTLSPDPHPRILVRPEGAVVRAWSWAAPASCDLGTFSGIRTFRKLVADADVVHYHFPWPFSDVLHKFGVERGKPSVMTYHSDVVRQRLLGLIYKPLMCSTLRGMTAVVATSNEYAQSSDVLRQIEPGRLKVIPLGIHEASYQAPLQDSAAVDVSERFGVRSHGYFLSLGVLRYYKGLHTLIEAASRTSLPILIAGQGPMRGDLEALAREKAPDRVRFVGHVTDAEKLALIANCRAFVLPSHLRSEAFGMVLVEASMLARPMISCAIGTGTTFVNRHEQTGLVIEPESPMMLASAMQRFADDAEFAKHCGLRARERYSSLFSGGALGRAYSRLYSEAIGRGASDN